MVIVNQDKVYINKHGKDHTGFYMDGYLKKNVEDYLIAAVKKKWDGVVLVTGIEGCLDKQTIIKTKDGDKRLKDIKNGFAVVKAFDFKKHEIVNTPAFVIDSGRKHIFEVELENGKKVLATSDHKFFIEKCKKIVERRLKKIKVGDKLICLKEEQ